MSDFKHSDSERVSRNRAAERLVDLAYALTVGRRHGDSDLDGERVSVPLAREVVLASASESEGREVKLESGAHAGRCPRLVGRLRMTASPGDP